MQSLPSAFDGLSKFSQFILYKLVPRPDGKVDKLPVDPTTWGCPADAHDPAIWLDHATAIERAKDKRVDGVGFVFTKNDPFFFIDIDYCLQADNTWSETAIAICHTFPGAAIEVSQSGTGLHIIGSYLLEEPEHRKKCNGFELYTSGRFVALTGNSAVGDCTVNLLNQLTNFIAAYAAPTLHEEAAEWTSEPCEDWAGLADDDQLIEKMLSIKSAANVFGDKASVADLWNANADILARNYPPYSSASTFDHSSADAALCQHLAFWTGKDCERMDRLFRRSALYREKWDREDYKQSTVLHATGNCRKVYSGKKKNSNVVPLAVTPVAATMSESIEHRTGYQLLTVTQQEEYFKGCVYVRDDHKIFTPDGSLLDTGRFRATYGGYVFALDNMGDKTTKNAWEAFTESQGVMFPKAHGLCFRPEIPPGTRITEESKNLVNIYVPIVTEKKEGNPSKFLELMEKVLPQKRDRDILLAFMAAMLRYPGKKFQWTPLLQGMEGNGKTILINIMSHAIGRRYTHLPNAKDLGNKFNFWLVGKLFIGVEEIYVADKQEIIDSLKPMITNDRIEIQPKGGDQYTGDNRANFIMCSNHKDAIRKTKNDRRFCVMYTGQQQVEDLTTSGMDGNYFPLLYNWLRKEGYAVVNNYLSGYDIPDEYNPATDCHRAPLTSSTDEVLALSRGRIEQEILEAVDEGRPGFSGGWVSSLAFDRMLETNRDTRRITIHRRKTILLDMGYELHKGLQGGRSTLHVPLDGGKPRLYIKLGHANGTIVGGAEISRAYMAAQDTNLQGLSKAMEIFI